ncbi:NYN domain-containing protein [Hellea sp.]|nr:NYN domain-containing protein [Hellea sp.]
MTEVQPKTDKLRASVYIDGFNLYYPIHEMGEDFMKWSSLWEISELLSEKGGCELQKVVFCTAVPREPDDKRARHNTFNTAQAGQGVTVIKGHHVWDDTAGKYSEKQSDINVALSLLMDAEDDLYDAAYLISADSDQAATARVFKERHPKKKLICVAPPSRNPPTKCVAYADFSFTMKKDLIERCIMDNIVPTPSGAMVRRPERYDPPKEWVHPKKRPKFNPKTFGL